MPARIISLFAVLALAVLSPLGAAAAGDGASGLPLPRYVSLKSDKVNVRKGPGTKYAIAWVFNKAGLPVEVLDEVDAWRQVRDSEGAKGWVLQGLLSGRRTALVQPEEAGKGTGEAPTVPLLESADRGARVIALIEAGALLGVVACDRTWCNVSAEGVRGYVEQVKLWGVYPDETIE